MTDGPCPHGNTPESGLLCCLYDDSEEAREPPCGCQALEAKEDR